MSDKNRQRILYISTKLFNSHGYKNVTVDEIAESLGMSKKTIYKYFNSKEQIVEEILHTFASKIEIKKNEILFSNGDNPYQKIKEFILSIKDDVSFVSPLFLKDIKKYMPELWNDFHQKQIEKVLVLDSFIKDGQKLGIFKDIKSDLVIQIILSAVEVIAQPDFIIKNGFTIQEIFDALTDIFISGLLVNPQNKNNL